MTNPLRVIVVGSGIGAQHIKAFRAAPDLFEVTAICDIDPKRARALAEEHAIPELLTDFNTAIQRTGVDIIDICTPPNLHFGQIHAAVEAGKHVICEKPVVGSLAELDQLQDLSRRTGKQIMPIFQYRFGRGLQKLKYLVERQLTGEAFVFNVDVAWWRSRDYYSVPWRGKRATELGGALLSQAIHAVDMVFYIDRSLGTISVTLGSAAQISRHRFTFRNLSAESNTEPYANSAEPWVFSFPEEKQDERIERALSEFTPSAEGYEGQFRRFSHSFKQAEALPVSLADARRVLEFIAAVYYSAESGEPVSLPLTQMNPKYIQL